MSSWGDYILKLLEKGYVTDAALHGLVDGKRWATSPGFNVPTEHALEIVNWFQDFEKLRLHGISVGQDRYSPTYSDGKLIVGQHDSSGAGCVLYKCHTCVIIAIHDKTVDSVRCQSVVERVGDFLRNNGY